MSIRTTEKVNLKEYERRASKEQGLNYELVEKVVENNFIHQITVEELSEKISRIAASKCRTIVMEVLGILRTPAIVYEEGSFEAYIETRETEETFKLISHSDDVGNLEFSIFDVEDKVIWDRWNGYFLIKFLENDIEVMISYLDYNF